MTKKELSQIASLKKEIQTLEMLQREIVDSLGESGTQLWDEAHKREERERLRERAEQICRLTAQLEVKKQELAQRYQAALAWLDQVPDSELRRIYTLRYLMGRTWQQVSNDLGNNRSADAIQLRAKRFLQKN